MMLHGGEMFLCLRASGQRPAYRDQGSLCPGDILVSRL